MVNGKACQNVCKMSKLDADGLQQQKTASGSTSVNQEQESEAAIVTDSMKLDSRRLKKTLLGLFPVFISPVLVILCLL